MKLRKLILKNFRGYQNSVIDFHSELNVLVGKNDAGKSTILEALEIFFNSETVKPEIEDLCVTCTESKMTIGLVFEVNTNKEYLFDTANKTDLMTECLLNENNFLEIHKIWDCSKGKLTATSMTSYLVANYYEEYSNKPLLTLTISDLKKELEIRKDKIVNYDEIKKNTSASIRQAIYAVLENQTKAIINIPLNKEDGKKLYDSISSEFPLFFLFQSDRANKDSDREVQDPLKAITKKAIAEVEADLEEVRRRIEAKAISLGEETLQKLKEMSPEIANVLKPNIKNKAWDTLFSFSFEGDEGIPMNKRGSGVRRLIILNYFRAEAERNNRNDKNIIYAIEEPETSQHPDHQIMLIEALTELSKQTGKQVIITTHTPEIAKMVNAENLILIKKIGNSPNPYEGDKKLNEICDTLGLLPYYSKLVVCVEGEHDVSFLKNINKIKEFNEIINLESEKISIIPMIGSNLKNWAQRNYLANSNVVEFHLYDRDENNQYAKSVDQINARKDKSVGILTLHREMENYIPPELIETEFNINIGNEKNNWFDADIPKIVYNKYPLIKEGEIKRIINGKVTKSLNSEILKTHGVYEEIKSWFIKIRDLYLEC